MQLLVENEKNLNLRSALELAAEVQPIKVDSIIIDNVRMVLHLYMLILEQLLLLFGKLIVHEFLCLSLAATNGSSL